MTTNLLKRIYLIRHAETEDNTTGRSQVPEAPLSKKGRKQAAFVAERFLHIPVEVIHSSPHERTKETAETISKKIKKTVIYNQLFRELRRPSEIVGVSFTSPEYHRVIGEIEKHELDPNFRYSDEETLFELEARAREALEVLIKQPETDSILVAHTVFLKMIFAVMMTSDTKSSITLFRELRYFIEIQHTDISMVEYGEETRGGLRWRLRVLNDRAHLG
jgi:probable phosphoglycerate mutase